MVISRSAATHAECLLIEPRPTAHTMGYRREIYRSTAGHYPASGRYQATKARRYVSMATCLETGRRHR